MRLLRLCVVLVFVVMSILFVGFYVKEKATTDKTIPVITVEGDIIEVSFEATEEELLKGVTAHDKKDGNITNKIIVESVSKFLDDGICKVTYAVCDNDNNVANATRKIKFKNYESPKFSMKASTCYSIYEKINISDAISAYDCIDGDISRSIIVTSDDFTPSVTGVFNIEITVTNSKGDISTIKIPLVVEDRSVSSPEIELKEYLIYVDEGDEVDFSEYIVGATDAKGESVSDTIRIETNVDLTKKGTYSVHYYATDAKGAQGHTILNVIVG